MFEWLTGVVEIARWWYGLLVIGATAGLVLVAMEVVGVFRFLRGIRRDLERPTDWPDTGTYPRIRSGGKP